MSTQAQRLKQARLNANMTQKQVAEAVGIEQPSYSYLERSSGNSTHLLEIANVLGVNVHWLRTGEEKLPTITQAAAKTLEDSKKSLLNETYEDKSKIWIDIVNIRFSCGLGESIELHFDEVVSRAPFDPAFFIKKSVKAENVKLAYAKGDSMEPYVCNEDIFAIDLSDTEIRDGEFYAIYFEGEAMLKQIFKEEGGALILHSLNSKYRDKKVSAANGTTFKVIGRQFWRAG